MTQPDFAGDASRVVAEILAQLTAAHKMHGVVLAQVTSTGHLDAETRETAMATVVAAAVSLRSLAPEFHALHALPVTEQPDVELILLRLLTDSLSVAMAQPPAVSLMVSPEEIDDLLAARGHLWETS